MHEQEALMEQEDHRNMLLALEKGGVYKNTSGRRMWSKINFKSFQYPHTDNY